MCGWRFALFRIAPFQLGYLLMSPHPGSMRDEAEGRRFRRGAQNDRQTKMMAGAELMLLGNIHTAEPAKPMEPRRHGEPELPWQLSETPTRHHLFRGAASPG
jgi:hypothetical protein